MLFKHVIRYDCGVQATSAVGTTKSGTHSRSNCVPLLVGKYNNCKLARTTTVVYRALRQGVSAVTEDISARKPKALSKLVLSITMLTPHQIEITRTDTVPCTESLTFAEFVRLVRPGPTPCHQPESADRSPNGRVGSGPCWNCWNCQQNCRSDSHGGTKYGGCLTCPPPVFRAYTSIHQCPCPLAPGPKGRHGPLVLL